MYRTEIVQVKASAGHKAQRWLLCSSDYPGDVFDKIERASTWASGGNADCESTGKGDGWAETKNLAESLKLGRYGWDDGRKKMANVLDDSNVVRRSLPRKFDSMDVAGSYPIVPLAVAGDPVCMVTHGMESIKSKPVIRIVVNVAVSGAVTAATIMRRGGAILSWIDGLESAGFRCEVEIIETGLFREYQSPQLGVLFSMTGKRADEPLDIDRLSFLLCHPSVQRRIWFKMYETETEQAKLGLTPQEAVTYGAPTDAILEDWIGAHSIYFPAMLRNNPDYATPATAVAAVERMILKAIQVGDVEADQQEGMKDE